jgi:hypothetical protein
VLYWRRWASPTADISGGDPTSSGEIVSAIIFLTAFLAFFGGLGLLAFSRNLRLQAAGGVAVVSSLALGAGAMVANGNWTAAAMASAIILIVVGAAVLAHRKPRRPGAGYDLPAVRFLALMFAIEGFMFFLWTLSGYAGLFRENYDGSGGFPVDIQIAMPLAAGLIALIVVVGRPPTFRRMRKRLLSRRPAAD